MNESKTEARIEKLEDSISKRKDVIRTMERSLNHYKTELAKVEEELKEITDAQKAGRPVVFKPHCKYCFERFDDDVEDGETCSACGLDGR